MRNRKRKDRDHSLEKRLRNLSRCVARVEPETGIFGVSANRRLGLVVIDHKKQWPDGTDRPAVGIVDAVRERALIGDDEEYDELAQYLEAVGVEVDRREGVEQ